MIDLHPSESAVGTHLDEEFEIAALEKQYAHQGGSSLENRARAEREYHSLLGGPPTPEAEKAPTENDVRTEEMMHLDL